MKYQKSKNSLNNYIKYSNMAIQMAVIIVIGVFGGIKLDKLLKLNFPLFTVIFSLLSVFFAIYLSVKDLFKKNK
jgi:F0F1-type ATP synthase assembly protein I